MKHIKLYIIVYHDNINLVADAKYNNCEIQQLKKIKKVFKKLLTSNQNSDNIKKSLEGDEKNGL